MGTRRNRNTLKSYFRSGNNPNESQFEDLIDSVPNLVDDGMERTEKDGLMLSPAMLTGKIISVYPVHGVEKAESGMPCWTFVVDREKAFHLMNEQGETVWSVSQKNELKVHDCLKKNPENPGAPNIKADTSDNGFQEILADSCWYNLPIVFDSSEKGPACKLCQITAGYRTGKDKYRMVTVTTTYCKGGKRNISPSQRCCGFWKNPIRFRWRTEKGSLYLQIKGKKKKKGESKLHFQIRELWNYVDATQ
ncbi:hypothetical protein [Bacteroides sp.]|uniref:hypothetical protein n=1 Tax=Bacteroides sp. TaxID=29523 RepID=UPI00262E5F99|nr:hypothetical protein [Bacteroides sp.]MDD3038139.1 hypothetical protein [Bacteroides sp.]